MSELSVALVHYPVFDRQGEKVATNVTNFDVHDIARACQVYGVSKYFIVTPMKEQLMFVSRILDHWRVGYGARYNPMRRTALDPVLPAESIEQVLAEIGKDTVTVATSAREVSGPNPISFKELRKALSTDKSHLLIFGTGFGLHQELIDQCSLVLEPIRGVMPKDYRHLSVRSAVSICLDRLKGSW